MRRRGPLLRLFHIQPCAQSLLIYGFLIPVTFFQRRPEIGRLAWYLIHKGPRRNMSALLGLSLNIWNEPLDMFEQPQVHSHFFQPIKIQLATAVATFGRNRAERSVVNRMIFVKARHQNSWSILPSNGHHNRKRLGKVDVEPSINVFPRVQQLERKVPFEFKMRHALDFS